MFYNGALDQFTFSAFVKGTARPSPTLSHFGEGAPIREAERESKGMRPSQGSPVEGLARPRAAPRIPTSHFDNYRNFFRSSARRRMATGNFGELYRGASATGPGPGGVGAARLARVNLVNFTVAERQHRLGHAEKKADEWQP